MAVAVAMLYTNVGLFFSGDTAFMKDMIGLYMLLFVFILVVFNEQFPIIFGTPMSVIGFLIVFFGSSLVLLTIPKVAVALTGSIATVVHAVSVPAFIQSFLAAFVETIIFIYVIYRKVPDVYRRYIYSQIFFISFHLSMIWSRLNDPAFAAYPWTTVVGLSAVSLFILNTVFQLFYAYGQRKNIGPELAIAVHFSWDLYTFGVLALLFGGIIIPVI